MLLQVGLTGPQEVAGWTGVFDIAVAGLPKVNHIIFIFFVILFPHNPDY